ncbi:MAG: cytochrome c biogenesis protein CcsA [Chromatiales bacterium]|nr:cytochrome c biogenesis protein CcsA [Chromatiales bacterium]
MDTLAIILPPLLYLLAAGMLLRRLAAGVAATANSKMIAIVTAFIASSLHGYSVYSGVVIGEGIILSFFLALSFTSWLAAILILLTSLRQPIENLGIAVFPFAALSLLLQGYHADSGFPLSSASSGLQAHILISAISYSLLTLAALQAIMLAIQNKQLRNRHPGGFIRALPPLETMESILFQLIAIGYLLLSLSLITGLPYARDLIAQHLVHKTVLSVTAWFVFAILLWGRWRFGWRGRKAVRWTLSGFVTLMFAYFGSKMVLELILATRAGA